MNKKIHISLLLLLLSLNVQAKTITLPKAIHQHLIKQTEKQLRSACEQPHSPLNYSVYSLDKQLLLFAHLPDEACYSRSVLPIYLNKTKWQTGETLDSLPSALYQDPNKQLWLVSHWESEGVLPYLHFSKDRVHWQNINLPDTKNIDCCFVYLKQLCVTPTELQIKLTGTDDTNSQYWSQPLKTNHWHNINTLSACSNTEIGFDDWQQSTHDHQIWLESKQRQLKIILPRWLK